MSVGGASRGAPMAMCSTCCVLRKASAPPAFRSSATEVFNRPTNAWTSEAVMPRCKVNNPTLRSRHAVSNPEEDEREHRRDQHGGQPADVPPERRVPEVALECV